MLLSESGVRMRVKNVAETPVRVGTLFSGIGAFEQALLQMQMPHEIVFACDNGEIELIPLASTEQKRYLELRKKKKSERTKEELAALAAFTRKIEKKNAEFAAKVKTFKSIKEKERFVLSLYEKYAGDKTNYVKKTYLANYRIAHEHFHQDVRFMDGNDYVGSVDIMVGGSPCQSFSTYGKKLGLEDARGTLFYEYARLIKEVQPKVFIYENVAGCLTHDNKRTWKVMKAVWESLGYVLAYKVLNSADYNHPQLRKRLFLIGFRKDIYKKEYEFPARKKLTKKSTDYLDQEPIPDIYYLGKKGFEWVTNPEKNLRRSRVNQEVIGCQTANQQDNWIGDFRVERPQPHHYADPRIFVGKYKIDGVHEEDAVARKLTPHECLNLMGFTQIEQVVEDRVMYRQAGNSIVVPVLKELIKSLIPYLKVKEK